MTFPSGSVISRWWRARRCVGVAGTGAVAALQVLTAGRGDVMSKQRRRTRRGESPRHPAPSSTVTNGVGRPPQTVLPPWRPDFNRSRNSKKPTISR